MKISKWIKANVQVSGDYGKKNTPLNQVGGSSAEKDYNTLLTHPYYIPEYVGEYAVAAYGPTNSSVSNIQNYNFNVLQNNGDYKRNMTSNMNINAGLEYDFGWNKWLKGLKLKFTYSKSVNTNKTNDYGTSYNLYYLETRSGSGEHLYTPIEGADNSAFENTSFYLANSGKPVVNSSTSDITGYLSRSMTRSDNYQMNFNAAYNRDYIL